MLWQDGGTEFYVFSVSHSYLQSAVERLNLVRMCTETTRRPAGKNCKLSLFPWGVGGDFAKSLALGGKNVENNAEALRSVQDDIACTNEGV